ENPARIVGLADQGRPLEIGEPANLTVVDPDATWTVEGSALAIRSDNTPYEAMELPAAITLTLLRGTVTERDGHSPACVSTSTTWCISFALSRPFVRVGGVAHQYRNA